MGDFSDLSFLAIAADTGSGGMEWSGQLDDDDDDDDVVSPVFVRSASGGLNFRTRVLASDGPDKKRIWVRVTMALYGLGLC